MTDQAPADSSAVSDEALEAHIYAALTYRGYAAWWMILAIALALMTFFPLWLASDGEVNSLTREVCTAAAVILAAGIVISLICWQTQGKEDVRHRNFVLGYSLDTGARARWDALNLGLKALSETQYLRYSFFLVPNDPRNLFSTPCRLVQGGLPSGVQCNLRPWSLQLGDRGIYTFLPDRVLNAPAKAMAPVFYARNIRSKAYQTLDYIAAKPVEEPVMDGSFPTNGHLLRWEYLHQRRDGGPDRRYADNPRFPVISALDIEFWANGSESCWCLCTDGVALGAAAAKAIAMGMDLPFQGNGNVTDQRATEEETPADASEPSPFSVLQVPPNATLAEIDNAYRRLAKQYHPDRVATMGPEIREVAERKMQEINAAYGALRAVAK